MEGLAAKFAVMRPVLGEGQWRWYLGSEARALGRGGVAAVARAAGVSQALVAAGVADVESGAEPPGPGRQRRPGGGRKRAEDRDRGLTAALLALVEPTTRGDPVTATRWTTLSLRELSRDLAGAGHPCGKDTVARLLREAGFSLQGMSRVLEGGRHPDRDAQFAHVAAAAAGFAAAGDPVVSVDAKKKEQLGRFHRGGRCWRPRGDPVRVATYDFPDPGLGKVAPYGVYDVAANRGFVSVGTSRDTAAFAVASLRRWWLAEGRARYPGARRLLVTCDAGGSNACASWGWKDQLARFAAEAGLEVTVCHYPPGTSKWNKIEHRLFCHLTRSWRARPLMTWQDAVAGIAATVTAQGLTCAAVLDEAHYPGGVRVTRARVKELEERVIARHPFHGEWNYALRPVPALPGPPPAPRPPALLAPADLAALAGAGDLGALAAAAALPWHAAREERLRRDRGGAPRQGAGPAGPRELPFEAVVAAAVCRLRLRATDRLLAGLLGVGQGTLSQAVRRMVPVLHQLGITAIPGQPYARTLTQLHDHAQALKLEPDTKHPT